MNSLRIRILAIMLAGLLATVALTTFLVYLQAGDEIDELYDANLTRTAGMLARQLGDASWVPSDDVNLVSVRVLERWQEEDLLVQIWDRHGNLIESLPDLPASHAVPLQPTREPLSRAYGGFGWRLASSEGERYIVQVGQPERPRRATIAETSRALMMPLLIQMPIFLLVVWFAVYRGLLPLNILSRELARRGPESLQPVRSEGLPDELKPLVESLNALLNRLDIASQQQRNFISDAAHELRTPAAALRLQLDAYRRADSEEERSETIGQLDAGIRRLSMAIAQLLVFARSEWSQDQDSRVPMSLESVGREALERHLPVARHRGIDLGISQLDAGVLNASPGDVDIVLDNLLGNAINYSASGGRVDLAMSVRDGEVIVDVADDGLGIPVADREAVFRRFYRGLGSNVEGTGLGLSIVKAICDRYGARIEILDGLHGRGARFRIWWPVGSVAEG